jgi:protein-S-isoprenylcysteine O-methyltransferase Ste14
MNANSSAEKPSGKSDTTSGVVKWLRSEAAISILVLAATLFISSGHLDWIMGWVYLALFVIALGIMALILASKSPELLAERSEIREGVKGWDRVLGDLVGVYVPIATWIVAGLNVRCGWLPQVPLTLQIAALAIAALGYLLTLWAMMANKFYSGYVRIQKDRDHTVVTTGPYRYIRHPGYVGAIVFNLATPLVLGSLWALIPAGLTMCLSVLRTALEDKTLQDELDGYKEYTEQVRYRLLPGIW